MPTQPMRSGILTTTVLILATCTLLIPNANAGERTLHTFIQSTDGVAWGGVTSVAGLVADPAGNLYGTTMYGGKYGYGVVFELSRTGKGYWVEKVLHNFGDTGDGASPWGGLIFDASGNLYGTTVEGGTSIGGTVFELTPGRNGNWKEAILYSFDPYETGSASSPRYGLVMDSTGNLYGETDYGGTYGHGTVFEMSLATGGGWTESVAYSFGASPTDGIDPVAPYLTLDTEGNLYGVTSQGGPYNSGTVFQLSRGSGGQWAETLVYAFTGSTDGSGPASTVTLGPKGNLYGTTEFSSNGRGTVYEISPSSSGGWSEQTIYSFVDSVGGETADLTLILDSAGNLYGTSPIGGANNWGDVFELSPASSGTWNATILHSFDQTDGQEPYAGVLSDAAGNLYGLTPRGGDLNLSYCRYQGCGVAFEITP